MSSQPQSTSTPATAPTGSGRPLKPTSSTSQHDYPKIVPGGGLIISWQLKGRKVLLVGGGPVAAGRLVNVKDADAHLTVMCPSSGLCPEMRYRIKEEGVVDVYLDRVFGGDSDLEGYDMVLTAIDDVVVSRNICELSRARKIPVNIADVPPECDFYFGSLIRRGPLQVMVSTGGKGPRIAAQTRRIIERAIHPDLGDAIENVGKLRAMLRVRAPENNQGARRMKWMIDVCESWSFEDLAKLNEREMHVILEGWQKGTVPSPTRVRGLTNALPTPKSAWKTLTSTCPVAGSISPWLSGIAGVALGAAVTSAIFIARPSR